MTFHCEETVLVPAGNHLVVRHIMLRGTNYEIGRHIGTLARNEGSFYPTPSSYPQVTRARRLYYQQHYPTHLERSRGAAAAYGLDFKDEALEMMALGAQPPAVPSCSAIYYPPQTTANGHGLLSRNSDFETWVWPRTNDIYVMEMYPDKGYPSLYITGIELLGACMDGVNASGLTVAMLGNLDPTSFSSPEPTREFAVGIYELQVARLLLDTCATAEEALLALSLQKHYYYARPCHYIIGDRFGHSFVWEYSPAHNKEFVFAGEDRPQIVSTHPMYLSHAQQEPATAESVQSINLLRHRLAATDEQYDLDFLKETNACAFMSEKGPMRTLWHSIYDTTERSLQASFYLGPESLHSERVLSGRSAYMHFQLC